MTSTGWLGVNGDTTGKVELGDEKWNLLAELADASEYWSKAHDFLKSVQDREFSSLSHRQVDWYYSIDASLDKELQLREAREAFGKHSEQAKRAFDRLFRRDRS